MGETIKIKKHICIFRHKGVSFVTFTLLMSLMTCWTACAPTTYVQSINECFHPKTGSSQTP